MKLYYPFEGKFKITQKFRENPANYKKFGLAGHDGIDFATPNGTKLLAPMKGKTYVGWASTTWGLYYGIENDWGTVYLCHLKENYLPSGVEVAEKQLIGETDNSGNSTGPHLHIGLRVKGFKDAEMKDFVDPLPYFEEEQPEDVTIAGQDEAIKQYQQNIEDLNEILRLPIGNKDIAIIKQKCTELMKTKQNYDSFLEDVAKGIGCKEETEKAVREALIDLEARIKGLSKKKLESFPATERIVSGFIDLILRRG